MLFGYLDFFNYSCGVDSLCRTLGDTLVTKTTLLEVNVGKIVGKRDCLKRTHFHTLSAADTSG